MVLQVPLELRIQGAPGGRLPVFIKGDAPERVRGVFHAVAAQAVRHVDDDLDFGGCGSTIAFAHLGADARVVRHVVRVPVASLVVPAHARLQDAAARAVVGHHELVGVLRAALVMHKFNRHTSPIIGNFQALGLAQSAIHYGSAIKMHKCIFAALTLQVFVLDEIARRIVYKVAGDIHIAFIRRQVSDMLVDFFQFIGIFIIGVFAPGNVYFLSQIPLRG